MFLERFLASSGFAIGNLILFAGVASTWPQLTRCSWSDCPYGDPGRLVFEMSPFRPFIDNPGRSDLVPSTDPKCPRPEVRGSPFDLEQAPLPRGFDPLAYPAEKLFACVLVGSGGAPTGVRLIGVRDGEVARSLAATIETRWHFSRNVESGDPGWLRVRLNAGPMEAEMGYVRMLE